MEIGFSGADCARRLNVDILSMLDEVVVDVVEELRVGGVLMIGGHVNSFRSSDDGAIGQSGSVSAVGFDGDGTCDDIFFYFPFGEVGDAFA